jgi:hypothetical protein
MDPEVVILGADGTEHVFPPGFDPVKAAAIVRGGPKPLGPPNQHTATAEEFTDPSVGGFINNAVNDVKGMVGVLDVRNWRGMSDAKQAAESQMATDAHSERPAFQFPGDRLAKQLQSIPQDVYQNPVQAAMLAAPLVKPMAGAMREAAPGVAASVKSAAQNPIVQQGAGAAANALTSGKFGLLKGIYDIFNRTDNAAPAAAAAPVASDALTAEILKRISTEPDWRTVDAVPINAMQAKGVLHPGESRVGLAEGAAAAAKTDPQAAMELLKALRQRMHISEKAAGK